MKKKNTTYKVWLHMEEITEDGDTVKGEEYFGPLEAGEFRHECDAVRFRDKLAAIGQVINVVDEM